MTTKELNTEQKKMIVNGIDALYVHTQTGIDTLPSDIQANVNYILLKMMDLYFILENADSIQIITND